MITLPLSLLIGLLLGVVLSLWVPDSSEKASSRLFDRVRLSLVPLLSLTLGLWLPSSLCIYQDAPDWFLMYLVSPDRATPLLLAGLFTLLTLSVPLGLFGMLFVEEALRHRWSARGQKQPGHVVGQGFWGQGFWSQGFWSLLLGKGLGQALALLLGLAALVMWGADRLGWVGSFADFHDGRWLLAALGWGTPRLSSVLLITNGCVLIGVVAAGRAIAGRSSAGSSSSSIVERSASGQAVARSAAQPAEPVKKSA